MAGENPEITSSPCEEGSNAEEESCGNVPEWTINVNLYQLLLEEDCPIDAGEKVALVWPPMLLLCSDVSVSGEQLDKDIAATITLLAAEGVEASSLAITKFVCWEGKTCFHLIVLPPTGLSFAAAKAIDREHGLKSDVFYPSLKDMLDIKNGRVPEIPRRFLEDLNYHGKPRHDWTGLSVDLVRDDGVCVGRGLVSPKHAETSRAEEKQTSERHVHVRVLEVVDALLPANWKGCVRRWRTSRALYNGVSLHQCSQQHQLSGSQHPFYCRDGPVDGPDSAALALAQEVLKHQSISSVAPWIGAGKDLRAKFDHLPAAYSQTCRDAIEDIELNTFKCGSEELSVHDGKSFASKYESDEVHRKEEIERTLEGYFKRRNWIEQLGTSNSSHMTRVVVHRLTELQQLTDPQNSGTLITSMIKGAEEIEVGILHTIGEKVRREKQHKMAMADVDVEIERFILQRKEEQHEELLKEVASIKARHLSTFEAFVQDQFKFMEDIEKRRKETDSVHQWLTHRTTKAAEKEKKNWKKKLAEVREQEQKKREEQVAKALTEQQKWQEEQTKVCVEEQNKWKEEQAKARIDEQNKWKEEQAQAHSEEQNKWKEEQVQARIEEQKTLWRESAEEKMKWEKEFTHALAEDRKKYDQKSANVAAQLALARQQIADQKEAMPKCGGCYEHLDGSAATCGQKRSREDVVFRRRACFTPCMHSTMCLECSLMSWEKFKRCPVCCSPCSLKPQTIFM